ncbi:MAG: MarR family winged helix-turn-helix transcriptional regulator [Parasphingorhabdus sp.]
MMMVLHLIPRINLKIAALSASLLKPHGISPGQRSLMEDLDQQQDQTIGTLAKARPVAKQYVQKLMSDLHGKGFVEYRDNPKDGRSKIVELSSAGEKMLQTWRTDEIDSARSFAELINTNDAESCLRFLDQLNLGLDQELAVLSEGEKDDQAR